MGRNFEQARYAGMRWNTPLSEGHAARLLERLEIGPRQSVLDLGCGWGELLLRGLGSRSVQDRRRRGHRRGPARASACGRRREGTQ